MEMRQRECFVSERNCYQRDPLVKMHRYLTALVQLDLHYHKDEYKKALNNH